MEATSPPAMERYGAIETESQTPIAHGLRRISEVPSRRGWPAVARVAIVTLAFAAVLAVAAASSRVASSAQHLEMPSSTHEANMAHAIIGFECSNKYTSRSTYEIGGQYPWVVSSLLIEPHLESHINVTSAVPGATYSWVVTSSVFGKRNTTHHHGERITYTCQMPGAINFTLIELTYDNGESHHRYVEATVQCRYVRREIRTLDTADAAKLISAMQTVYTLDELAGRERYGHRYSGITTFVNEHNVLAGNQYCDHMHDGFGFMNQHMALTRWFEYVLQLIEPSVTMPYWDFTIEGQAVNRSGDASAFRQSVVFSDAWFGSLDSNGPIIDGKFPYTKCYFNAKNISTTANAYGFMRAPWNQNKDNFVSRFNTSYGFEFTAPPDCDSHYKVMQMRSWAGFGKEIMYSPHGPVHLMIGGVANSDWQNVLATLDVNWETTMLWAPSGFSLQKNMYRNGKLSCPVTCSLDTPMTDCKCTCPQLEQWLKMPKSALIEEVLNPIFANISVFMENKHGEFIGTDLLKLLCNADDKMAPIFGESLESASPADASFWPIHPTVDRLLSWRRLVGLADTTWWNNVSWSVLGYKTGYCWGHNFDDVLPWPEFLFSNTAWVGPYTNEDLWNIANPENSHSPYIYDSFHWPHCEAAGYPLTLIK